MSHAKFIALNCRYRLRPRRTAAIIAVFALVPHLTWAEGSPNSPPTTPPVHILGATAIVTEISSGMQFPARVDTGAMSCSIHCDAVEIQRASVNPKENIGKHIRFRTKGADGKPKWVQTKVADFVIVRTADRDEERYKVALRLRCNDVEKNVLVTLNNREKMSYPMLLGRNFLRDDFLVNVSADSAK